ncbi:hypothetical protein GCG54_00015379 [Colletotrichum gloeosporioides]|uniref:Rhodopsin domain-containing protein n=1 Tax=Colletotrichum gloeosporioides TaxID=474922 RepID=A0A8H4FP31_COLGL|nr:uncharacterized protein GCG54_00015379 [Colletotrichum gloeosporioides]KAF3807994.1 hypothetical protein GCG54_00015379 [Colletotrichum gloeosporioides]
MEGVPRETYPKASRRTEVRRKLIISCSLGLFVVMLPFRATLPDVVQQAILIAVTTVYLHITSIGFGMHYWTILVGNGVVIRKSSYKVRSLGCIFLSETLRRIVLRIQLVLPLHGTLFTMPFAAQCVPLQSIWDRTITNRRCLNLPRAGYSSSGLSIAEDMAILLLPGRKSPLLVTAQSFSPAAPGSDRAVQYWLIMGIVYFFPLIGGHRGFSHHVRRDIGSCGYCGVIAHQAVRGASLPSLRLLLISIGTWHQPALSDGFLSKDSPNTDSGHEPLHTGNGVLVMTTVEVDQQSCMVVDVPPFPPPAYSGSWNT